MIALLAEMSQGLDIVLAKRENGYRALNDFKMLVYVQIVGMDFQFYWPTFENNTPKN